MKSRWMPARVGDALHEVDTPALVLDIDRFEANLERLMQSSTVRGMRVRPHAKSHKCVEVARRQMAAGAVGICCQKVSEAEVFLAGGIDDVLVTNEIIGKRKVTALAALAVRFPQARVGVCVDDVKQVRQLATACRALAAQVDVYIEIDVGHGRAGVPDTASAVELAEEIAQHRALRLRGLQAYYGSAQHRRGVRERRQAITLAATLAGAARDGLIAAGHPCEIVTGGGTGTFPYETGSGVYNEVQPGSYVLMDIDYGKNEFDPIAPAFEPALYILTSVMSARGDRVTLDAGLKAFSTDSGPAMPAFEGWQVRGVSDEHTVLIRAGSEGPNLVLGDKPLLIPGHIDPTVNLHDVIVVSRNDVVIDVWPIEARGAVF
jgi:D-serine deaminase-like pyridoxal phosphate-dependent protein